MRLGNMLGYLFVSVVGCSLLAGLAAGLFLFIWGASETINGISSSSWQTVEGTVVSTDLLQGDDDQSWLANIVYAYTVDGKQFRGKRQRFDGGCLYSGDRNEANRYLEKHAVGGRTLIRYDSRHPEMSVLEPGFQRLSLFMLAGGLIFMLGTSVMAAILWRVIVRLQKVDEPQPKDGLSGALV